MSATITQPQQAFGSVLESNKSMMSKIEDYRSEPITAKQRNLAFGGMVVGGSLLAIVFATQIITGMFALILTAVTVGGGFYGWKTLKALDPAIRQKLKNANLKMMIEEARRNAITQLDNQVLSNTERLRKAQQARNEMGGTLMKMKSKMAQAEPGTDFYKRQEALVEKVEKAYEQICNYLGRAKTANVEFERKVYEYKQLDQLSNMANAALSTFNDASGMDINQMLSLEAFESIEDSFHTSITALENRASDLALED